MKDCGADRAQSIDLLRRRPAGFRVLTGEDAQYHEALTDGADGAILLSAHSRPKLRLGAARICRQGNRDAALACWEGHFRTHPAAVRRAEPGAGEVLAGAERADRQRADVRLPMVEVSAELAARLDAEIERRARRHRACGVAEPRLRSAPSRLADGGRSKRDQLNQPGDSVSTGVKVRARIAFRSA